MTLIHLSMQTRARPSELLALDDPYTAYCLDEVCLYMVEQARDKKMEPDFDRPARIERQRREKDRKRTTNADAIEALTGLGVKLL